MKKIRRQKIKQRGLIPSREPLVNIQDKIPLKLSTRHRMMMISAVLAVCLFITVVLGQSIEPFRTFYGTISRPFQKAYLAVENFVSDTITTAKRLQSLEAENERLTKELELYVFENTTLKNDVAKMDELQQLYNLDNYYEAYPKTGAQIVGLSNNNWYETFIIDKGAVDGMERYMPVLASGGLLGHISEVYDHYSIVTTIIDKSSSVFGEVNRKNRDTVQVEGTAELLNDDLCKIEYTSNEIDLVVGDDIVTSALGEVYPPGLLIGTVIEINEDAGGLMNVAYLKPQADLENLSYVLVITELWKQDMANELSGENTDE